MAPNFNTKEYDTVPFNIRSSLKHNVMNSTELSLDSDLSVVVYAFNLSTIAAEGCHKLEPSIPYLVSSRSARDT